MTTVDLSSYKQFKKDVPFDPDMVTQWALVRTAPASSLEDTNYTYCTRNISGYHLTRVALCFDLSALSGVLVSATLTGSWQRSSNGSGFGTLPIHLFSYTGAYPFTDVNDYSSHGGTDFGTINGGLNTFSPVTLTFGASGLAYIRSCLAGKCSFFLRPGPCVTGTAPSYLNEATASYTNWATAAGATLHLNLNFASLGVSVFVPRSIPAIFVMS